MNLNVQLVGVESQTELAEVKESIKAVEKQIAETESKLESAEERDVQYLRGKEKRLRDKEKQLRDKEMQLREAQKQLREEQLILLRRQEPGPVSDFVAAFKQKLSVCHIQRPNQKAMTRLMMYFPQQMQAAAQASVDPSEAQLLYQHASALPGTETRVQMTKESHITINGPWLPSRPHLVTAVDLQSAELLVLKLLPPLSKEHTLALVAEDNAIKSLNLAELPSDSPLVRCQMQDVSISAEHSKALQIGRGEYKAVRMPMFASSLSALPQLSEELIFRGAVRLQSGLEILHAANILHADVKGDNVLLNRADQWHLADYGASVRFDEPIRSCTEGWYPGSIRNEKADPKYDWGLLVVLIAVELDKAGYQKLTGNSDPAKVQLDIVLAEFDKVQHTHLKRLISDLVLKAGWSATE